MVRAQPKFAHLSVWVRKTARERGQGRTTHKVNWADTGDATNTKSSQDSSSVKQADLVGHGGLQDRSNEEDKSSDLKSELSSVKLHQRVTSKSSKEGTSLEAGKTKRLCEFGFWVGGGRKNLHRDDDSIELSGRGWHVESSLE